MHLLKFQTITEVFFSLLYVVSSFQLQVLCFGQLSRRFYMNKLRQRTFGFFGFTRVRLPLTACGNQTHDGNPAFPTTSLEQQTDTSVPMYT